MISIYIYIYIILYRSFKRRLYLRRVAPVRFAAGQPSLRRRPPSLPVSLAIGSIIVPFGGLYLESYKVIRKKDLLRSLWVAAGIEHNAMEKPHAQLSLLQAPRNPKLLNF